MDFDSIYTSPGQEAPAQSMTPAGRTMHALTPDSMLGGGERYDPNYKPTADQLARLKAMRQSNDRFNSAFDDMVLGQMQQMNPMGMLNGMLGRGQGMLGGLMARMPSSQGNPNYGYRTMPTVPRNASYQQAPGGSPCRCDSNGQPQRMYGASVPDTLVPPTSVTSGGSFFGLF